MRDPDKPQQIIDAAIRVFARNGYYNSRVSDIAREAGIASGTIYLYFKTKDEILVTLFREKMAGFVGVLRKEVAGEPAPPARAPALRDAGGPPRHGRGRPGRAAPGPEVLPRRLRPRDLGVLRPHRLRAPGGRGGRRVPARPAREGRHQDAVRRHGPGDDLLGTRQARLPARGRRRARGQHLPQRSHPRWDLRRSFWSARSRTRSSRSTAHPPTPSARRSSAS